jgi:cell division protein FtsQ
MATKIDVKKLLRISAVTLLIAAFLLSAGLVKSHQKDVTCKSVNINIDESEGNFFVEQSDILNAIRDKWGTLVGKRMDAINMNVLETMIQNNPFILRAEVFSTIDGEVNIDVKQREPVLRIINSENQSFYIDKKGMYMPVSDKFASYVPVASGSIPDRYVSGSMIKNPNEINSGTYNKTLPEQLFELAMFTRNDELWGAQFVQYYVNEDGDIELIPRVGNHRIILGDTQNMKEKFDKLRLFYKEGLQATDWNKYNTINLKFADQVVCTKTK